MRCTTSLPNRSCRRPGATGIDRRVHGAGRDANAGRDPRRQSGDPLLSGQRPARCSARCRRHRRRETTPFYPRIALRRRQGLWPLDHRQLPRKLRHVSPAPDPVQSRIAAPRQEFVTRKVTHGVARIKLGCKRSCDWAIWTPSATGVLRAITCGPCG